MSAPRRGPQHSWVGSSLAKTTAEVPSLEAAIQDAWDQASHDPGYDELRDPDGQLELRVLATYVIGTNPITEYRVVLGPA